MYDRVIYVYGRGRNSRRDRGKGERNDYYIQNDRRPRPTALYAS